ncbi:hypothetical protein COCMIDRAFT_24325 [Bipolaris oryzae ATCC 44560]|uniref:Wax synthase domain-containing protein n=1 Tax=Bipolaris oryzae ATCC 44560 TaxID=930090 RepID=W6ZJZ5_COCMI|nr:uncharacterized protein COCMIDRAFT_24325 [Bipolaris oryzae ATCC 44560]EUC47764.1 hypothetical protein COCMIDRAFT_24325 [Bipolaris oryzae ATCC 44560]
MPGRYVHPDWSLSIMPVAAVPLAITIAYGIYILAYPPATSLARKQSMLYLLVPAFFTFRYCDYISPDSNHVDTLARACIIWFAHMSYEVCILEFKPDVRPGPNEMKERIKQAYKVFFDRSHVQIVEQQQQHLQEHQKEYNSLSRAVYSINVEEKQSLIASEKKTDDALNTSEQKSQQHTPQARYQHGYSRWQFVLYHTLKTLRLYAQACAWEYYDYHVSPFRKDPDAYANKSQIPFFSRLPSSLHWREVYWRTEEAFSWNVPTKWMYESYHSVFAIIHVALGIDGPEEWGLGLFGNLSAAWSVRRYWRHYWHNFIYHSFSGHVKCVTRGWLGMPRNMFTRLVENTLVFFLSGLMHSAVRWQVAPWSDIWAITFMYTSQMVPLVIEGGVVCCWRKVRKSLGYGPDAKWVNYAEYAIGYFWAFAWQFYSVSTYWLVRDKWTEEKMARTYQKEMESWGLNETEVTRD